jgi:outer membrane usher protein FimD/PapC
LGASNYASGVLGTGLSFGDIGSLSADVTVADSQLDDEKKRRSRGQSYRVQYSKTVATTATTVTLASYRYSTEGFYTFQEVNEFSSQRYNKRSRLQLNLSQSLQSWGNFIFRPISRTTGASEAMSATSAPALTPVSATSTTRSATPTVKRRAKTVRTRFWPLACRCR